jgi:alpha galactosidase C-like protein
MGAVEPKILVDPAPAVFAKFLQVDATVRDLWQHKELGSFQGSFSTDVPQHGAVYLRITNPILSRKGDPTRPSAKTKPFPF